MTSSEKKPLNIAHLAEALCKADAYMSCVTELEDVVIFLDATRPAKSALINFLMCNRSVSKKALFKITVDKEYFLHGPQIAAAVSSNTIIQKLPGFVIWDTPGVDDNIYQDIMNTFYMSELIKNIKSAKIILLVDFAILHQDDSVNVWGTLLRKIENFFTNKFKDIFSGVGMIFTMVDKLYGVPITKSDIIGFLQYKIDRDTDISEAGKGLLQHLVNNRQNIGFVGNTRQCPITDDIASAVIKVINSVKAVPFNILREIVPGISESAKTSLCQARDQLLLLPEFAQLQIVIANVLIGVHEYVERTQKNNLDTDELFELSSTLSLMKYKVGKAMDKTVSFNKKVNALEMIDLKIKNYIKKHELSRKAKCITFVEKLLNLEESNLDISIRIILGMEMRKLNDLINLIRGRVVEINKENTKKEIAKIREQRDKQIKKLEKQLKEAQSQAACTIL